MTECYIGLMTGTSINGIDAALVDLASDTPKIISTHSESCPTTLTTQLRELATTSRPSFDALGAADNALGEALAQTCVSLIKKAGCQADDIRAIGSHGQTIQHAPNATSPYTIQIGNPHIIAQQTQITTVADFRRRDMALGGQAAPLVPAFHAHLLQHDTETRAVVNIGGITNLTYLPQKLSPEPVIGFDTGPGNTLLDAWCRQHQHQPFDDAGQWAASGTPNTALLTQLMNDPYIQKLYPKSTGTEYFHLNWLKQHIEACQTDIAPQNIQATLLEFTAHTITQAIQSLQTVHTVWLCGGGTENTALLHRLQTLLHPLPVNTTASTGIDSQWMEATAFAWMAQQTLNGQPGNIPTVTGASHATILGAIYPGNTTHRL